MTQTASAMQRHASITSDGLLVREKEPLNLEMPFSTLSGFTTPNESFYVRCHFPIPEIAASEWRLKVEGEVEEFAGRIQKKIGQVEKAFEKS